MSNQVIDKPTASKWSLFSPGGRRPKNLLAVALVLACMFGLSAVQGRADGFNITFFDTTDTLTFSITLSGPANPEHVESFSSCLPESCLVTITEPPVFGALNTSTSTRQIFEPGPNPLLSDFLATTTGFDEVSQVNFIQYFFQSDTEGTPLVCDPSFNCFSSTVETGLVQGIETVTTPLGFTDTISFQSDLNPVPEPSSILLLLTGFAGLGITKLRGKVVARAS